MNQKLVCTTDRGLVDDDKQSGEWKPKPENTAFWGSQKDLSVKIQKSPPCGFVKLQETIQKNDRVFALLKSKHQDPDPIQHFFTHRKSPDGNFFCLRTGYVWWAGAGT